MWAVKWRRHRNRRRHYHHHHHHYMLNVGGLLDHSSDQEGRPSRVSAELSMEVASMGNFLNLKF